MKPSLLILFLISFANQAVQLKEVITDLNQPVDVQFFPDSSSELLIAGKTGQLMFANALNNDKHLVHEFAVKSGSEMGLLGLAFHPNYPENKFIFVNYFPKVGQRRTRISRFSLTKQTKQEKRYSLTNEKVILEIRQPYSNHNGGQIAFGPDGFLYIGMGDGGSAGDPQGYSQNPQSLLGKMLRIDINSPNNIPYHIPQDNPFLADVVKDTNFKPEIWAYGLRNPWRFSFHKDVLIVADVGQNKFEEISIVEKGQNLGWNIMEATHCFKPKTNCDTTNLTLPKVEYGRSEGQSITGGYVYNGKLSTELKNQYIYGDFMSGNIWGVNYPSFTSPKKLMSKQGYLSTFALDADGEIYVAEYSKGIVYQIVP
ncbi:PQQ-dependent sugar dehydrogenase [uncultured Psychrosphaera sp.]|uniref:PQQ-dependent sugar dehydrogenase n=1 Tax=uncultured Psychrosphaera sp. TaxID=1403522 RepID=UPI0026262950|nr:PQQ-dependent sugar dehydrogenase [uncultured Psychrosphaera sp.]